MSRRPLCIIGCLVILILWSLNLMGVSTFGGIPLDLTDSDRSVIIQGILYKQESNSFYTSLYLKKTNLIQNSKKQSIDNVKATIKTEYLKQLPSDGDRLLIQGRLKQIQEPGNPGQFNERSYYYARKIKWYLEAEQVTIQKTEADKGVTFRSRLKELLKTKIKQITTKKTSGLFMAILLGEKSEVERETLLRMQLSAMSHCVVVSGVKTLKLDIPLVPETRIKWAFMPLHIAIIYILKLCLDEEIIPRCRFPCSRGYRKKYINWQNKKSFSVSQSYRKSLKNQQKEK